MARTSQRALAIGKISPLHALLYAGLLGIIGFIILAAYTNWLTFGLGAFAYVMYTVVYGYAKRHSVHGTLVGSISGALPPVAGYTAVTGRIDLGAGLVFLILVLWQMPHFYSIAIYRLKDYKAAGLPVWPVKKGIYSTKWQMFSYILAFIAATSLLFAHGYTGAIYFVVMLIVGLAWLRLSYQGFKAANDRAWARQSFKFSLIVIMTLAVMMSLGPVLP